MGSIVKIVQSIATVL